VAAGDDEAVRLAWGVDAGKLWCSSGEDEGTKGVAVFGDPSRMVDLARVVAHRLGFRLLRIKIHHRMSTIYRAFCTES
jgi:hypothetical protein